MDVDRERDRPENKRVLNEAETQIFCSLPGLSSSIDPVLSSFKLI